MSITFYSILHVFSVIVLTGFTFQAFAAPAEQRGRILAITGVASLVALVAAIGLLHKMGIFSLDMPKWIYMKFIAWLGISAMAGLAFRRRGIAGILQVVLLALVAFALYAVYQKPV